MPEKFSAKKTGVHPNTSYDQTYSPTASEHEEISDIQHAQRLSIASTPIDTSVPDRASRIMIRGDFPGIQQEAADGLRRLRTYLVATDLSSEAAYALEWTIGTVLRDGDTLLAVFAVDEETGTGRVIEPESVHRANTTRKKPAAVDRMILAAENDSSPLTSSFLAPEARKDSSKTSADSRPHQERLHAVESISQTCIKFLRKTKLQVRVGIEVIHCKSPKHIITEAVRTMMPFISFNGSHVCV